MKFKIVEIIKSAKISVKLTIVYALMFSLLLLILDASILYGVKYHLYSQANKQIEDVKIIVINNVTPKNEHLDLSDKELLSDIPSKQNIAVRVLQEDGNVLNTSGDFNYDIKPNQVYDRIKHLEKNGQNLAYKIIKIESKDYGTVYIQIVKDLENEINFIEVLFMFMAIADFIGIISSIILGYIISKKMLKPIDNITKIAENISINNLKERIEVNGPDDELKRLGDTFNKMIGRLQGSFNRQVQFVADASHELRTPIAVIQGYANLLDRWGKDDREALEKSIYAIKLEATNMANLVEKLLFLAKGDSGTQEIEKKEFLLNELISEVVRESKLIDADHIISSDKNDTISIFADYRMLKQMLRIFIDNSIKFAPEQSTIDISSEIQGKKVKITVSDMGTGIPKDDIEKIFDRFYTVDKSRVKEKGGTGLGLSIAKWILDMHQGTIDVESEEGKYAKIIVTLNLDE
ncbi:HAMP domain-containing histidine kinase [Clostridium gasigenes]|uniref:sensor histidine kinase n=1 Tax=Clostridium gasigenes TaxID=94869 RepID=UPI0014383A0C|nr:ATP-binding protein [Clostridium gasigenes]NKF06686.1 HAMP domain-containing histidine kinase [Clostridium gasigenes]QSW20964.1 HAMP domain-containing histidine kinase [Clostridium gasigenes]